MNDLKKYLNTISHAFLISYAIIILVLILISFFFWDYSIVWDNMYSWGVVRVAFFSSILFGSTWYYSMKEIK